MTADIRSTKLTGYQYKCGARQCQYQRTSRKARKRGLLDKARYMNVAEGSLEESRYYLILAEDLGYGETNEAMKSLEEVSRLLHAYSRALRKSNSELIARSS